MKTRSKTSSSNLSAEVLEDNNFLKFRRIVKEVQANLDLEKDRAEALSLHAGRLSRSLYGKKIYSPKGLIEASLMDLSYRARFVEIRARLGIQLSFLEKSIDTLRKHLVTKYNEELNDLFKTEFQRKAFLDKVVNRASETQSDIESSINMLDSLIKDIDQASFYLSNMREAMQLLDSSTKGQVV